MDVALSAVICTHNPREDYLARTLDSLRAQEALGDGREWELLLVDNAGDAPLADSVDLAWHPSARVIWEAKLGLSHARFRSYREARGALIVYIDDDNVLDPSYLRLALEAFEADPTLGAAGGKALPRYEVPPPPWFAELGLSLACRDLGDEPLRAAWPGGRSPDGTYPKCAPIGAGMAIRREAYGAYVEAAAADPVRAALGRRGADLASGEDNDMILTLLEQGWSVAYLPGLRLEHLIPARRLSAGYLERYAQSSNRTWIQVLDVHGMRPWPAIAPWTTPLRKARAYLRNRAWASPVNRIRFRAACGQFEGRASLGLRR